MSSSSSLSEPPSLNSAGDKTIPGDFAMWCFILAELAVFGVLFGMYGVFRMREPALFAEGQRHLALTLPILNTLWLIAGSATVVAAVRSFEANRQKQGRALLLATLLCGGGFVLFKLIEFYGKFSAGITLSTNDFWMFYLMLTVFHFLHVILGMVIVAAVWAYARDGRYRAGEVGGVETAAAYWHMVDLVWVVLFALVYVAR